MKILKRFLLLLIGSFALWNSACSDDKDIGINCSNVIQEFSLEGVKGTIDQNKREINLTLPFGTDLTQLRPSVKIPTDAQLIPRTCTAVNFSTPVTYTVVGPTGLVRNYNVSVQLTKSGIGHIADFGFKAVQSITQLNHLTQTILISVPYGTDIRTLVPKIQLLPGARISPASDLEQDFSVPVQYIVIAEDGSRQSFHVVVTVDPNQQAEIISFVINNTDASIHQATAEVKADLPLGTSLLRLAPVIEVSERATISPISGSVQDFTRPVTYTVTAENGKQKSYTVLLTLEPGGKEIVRVNTFSIYNTLGEIDETRQSIRVVLWDVNLTRLSPNISLTEEDALLFPGSGFVQDFTEPITYAITSKGGVSRDYRVEVVNDPHFSLQLTKVEIIKTPKNQEMQLMGQFGDTPQHVILRGANNEEYSLYPIIQNRKEIRVEIGKIPTGIYGVTVQSYTQQTRYRELIEIK